MRDLDHDVRAMLDPQTGNEIERYEKKERFKKDKQDRVILIPGDPQRQSIVRRVFESYFLKRIGTYRIAKMLNDEGTPAPRGGLWSSGCIQAMLRFSAYLGFGLASFRANGIYCKQSQGLPEPLKKNYGKKLKQIRPREDWYRVECPELEEYLPPEIRPLAFSHLNKYLDWFEHGHVPKSKPVEPKYGASERSKQFPLAGILKERSTGSEMRGSSSANRKYAYYRISRSHRYNLSAKQHLKRALPAKPIHRAVLEEIEQLICNAPDLRPMLLDDIRSQDRQRGGTQDEVKQLKKELQALDRKAGSLLDQLEGEFAEQAKSKLQKAENRKREITSRLDEIDQGPRMNEPEIEQMADGIIADMADLLDSLASTQSSDIRHVFEMLIDEAVCDLEKREVSFSLAIPASMLSRRDFCPLERTGPKSFYRTKKWASILLETVTIELPGACHAECQRPFKPKGCDRCRRKRKAA
ncbi:MAG: recombinase family protein [Phycisphaerales bacterium]|nr:recombinase family protein [Phycisphaerales bacterium]